MTHVTAKCPVCGADFDWFEDDHCPECGTVIDG